MRVSSCQISYLATRLATLEEHLCWTRSVRQVIPPIAAIISRLTLVYVDTRRQVVFRQVVPPDLWQTQTDMVYYTMLYYVIRLHIILHVWYYIIAYCINISYCNITYHTISCYWVFIKGGCSRRGVQWMGVVSYSKPVYNIIRITTPCFHRTPL